MTRRELFNQFDWHVSYEQMRDALDDFSFNMLLEMKVKEMTKEEQYEALIKLGWRACEIAAIKHSGIIELETLIEYQIVPRREEEYAEHKQQAKADWFPNEMPEKGSRTR